MMVPWYPGLVLMVPWYPGLVLMVPWYPGLVLMFFFVKLRASHPLWAPMDPKASSAA